MAVNATSATLCGGDCCDWLTQFTLATVRSETSWQWTYTSFVTFLIITFLLLVERLGHVKHQKSSDSVHSTLITFGKALETPCERAIRAWVDNSKANGGGYRYSYWCRMPLFILLHAPCAAVAALPAAAYILAKKYVRQRTITGISHLVACFDSMPQSTWTSDLLGNVLLISFVKLHFCQWFNGRAARFRTNKYTPTLLLP